MQKSGGPTVDPSNIEQARAWDGSQGDTWAENAAQFDRAIAAYQRPFLEAAGIGPTDRVLDIGCGTGRTARDAARSATAGSVLGVDLSSRMIGLAQHLATEEGLSNVRFEQADAQIHPFDPSAFDVAISRAGVMFFGQPVAAFRNIASGLRPGGRLVLLTWQSLTRNEWIREFLSALAVGRDLPSPPADAPGPFALSSPDRVRSILTDAGFVNVALEGLEARMDYGPDPDDAYRFMLTITGWLLDGLDEAHRMQALDALRASIAAHHTDQGVLYNSAAWIVSAAKP